MSQRLKENEKVEEMNEAMPEEKGEQSPSVEEDEEANSDGGGSPVNESVPVVAGYLSKLESGFWFFGRKKWKKRFCLLDGDNLFVSLNEQQLRRGSHGTFSKSTKLDLQVYDVCEPEPKWSHSFAVCSTLASGQFEARHTFGASDDDEMNKWIGSIQTAIKDARLSRKGTKKSKSKDGSKSDKTCEYDSEATTGTAQQDESQQVRLSPIREATALSSATKSRPRGPRGRRLPNNRRGEMFRQPQRPQEEQTTGKNISISTSLLDEIDANMNRQSILDPSPTERKRVSRSMSNLCISELRGLLVAKDDRPSLFSANNNDFALITSDAMGAGRRTSYLSAQIPMEQDVKRNSYTAVNMVRRPYVDVNPLQRLSGHETPKKQIMNVTQELNQLIIAPSGNNRLSRLVHERRNSSAQDYIRAPGHREVLSRLASGKENKDLKDSGKQRESSAYLCDLKASISQISAELRDVKSDIGGLQEILSDHKCDVIQRQLEQSLMKVEESQQKFALIVAEAEQARDEFKALVAQCQVILKSIQNDAMAQNSKVSLDSLVEKTILI